MISTPTTTLVTNASIGNSSNVLNDIHKDEINIAIFERDIHSLKESIQELKGCDVEIRASGTLDSIMNEVTNQLNDRNIGSLIADIKNLLNHFKDVSGVEEFRLLFATIKTNMCKKFHTDINDIRLLCTYDGPGTQWLTDDNIDKRALNARSSNASIVLDPNKIRQVKTGDVAILKGAMYPQNNTNAVVHRSPAIEEDSAKRLLLRIDTNESLKLWS